MAETLIPVTGDDGEHAAPTTTSPEETKSRSQRFRERLMTPLGLSGAALGLVAVTAGGTALALHETQEPAAPSPSNNPKNSAAAVPGNPDQQPPNPTPSSGVFDKVSPVTVNCMGTMITTVSEGDIYLVTPVIEDSDSVGDPRTSPNVYTVLSFVDNNTGEDEAYVAPGLGQVSYRPTMSATAPMLHVIDVSAMENPPTNAQEVQERVPFGDTLPDESIFPCPDGQLQAIAQQYGPSY